MKASVYIATSLDGFIARTNGDVDWLQGSSRGGGEDYGYEGFMASVDALVMGRNTFEKVLTFDRWPYGSKRVVVLSHHSLDIPTELASSVEASSSDPTELLSSLEQQGIGHVYIDGGKTVQSFLRAGLIDELIITRIPRLIGDGIPLFGLLDRDVVLKHIGTQSYDSGLVQSRYEVVQSAA